MGYAAGLLIKFKLFMVTHLIQLRTFLYNVPVHPIINRPSLLMNRKIRYTPKPVNTNNCFLKMFTRITLSKSYQNKVSEWGCEFKEA